MQMLVSSRLVHLLTNFIDLILIIHFPGDYMPGVPPVPISNTAVKPRAADGSRTLGPARVGCCQVYDPNALTGIRVFFVLYISERMKSQPNRNYLSNDDIETPVWLARALVDHFRPSGRVLEPCRASGRIYGCLPADAEWCEIKQGRDFLGFDKGGFDWIITNPPWSEIRRFLRKSMQVADNVVFLMTVNHAWTKARLRDVDEAGFGLKEILLVPTPKEFPQSGFQLGAVHYAKGYHGPVSLQRLQPSAY